jgi:hypothetical protein
MNCCRVCFSKNISEEFGGKIICKTCKSERYTVVPEKVFRMDQTFTVGNKPPTYRWASTVRAGYGFSDIPVEWV